MVVKILIVNRFFWPDESATAMLAGDLAEALVGAGHEVHVICSRALYGQRAEGLLSHESWKGVHVHRLFSTHLGRGSAWRRSCDLVSFHLSLRWSAPWICRSDVIFAMTDPPMLLPVALGLRTLRGGKVFHQVNDVYPDIAVQLGVLRPLSLSVRWLSRLYRRGLKRCTRVFVLGEQMARVIEGKGVSRERITLLWPWADGDRIRPMPKDENPFREKLGLTRDEVLVMYAGNMGYCHSFDTILHGAGKLREAKQIHFLLIGDGVRRDYIKKTAAELALPRCRVLPHQPREHLREILTAADIHLISQDPRTLGLMVPSKLAGILASERPTIYVGSSASEIAHALEHHACGCTIQDGDVSGFADRVRELAGNPVLRDRMGRQARKLFDLEYSKPLNVGRMVEAIEEVQVSRERAMDPGKEASAPVCSTASSSHPCEAAEDAPS